MAISVTKDGRTILSNIDYTKLRRAAYERSGGVCECGCGRSAPWPQDSLQIASWEGELDHIHGRGGGKRNDALSDVRWIRSDCHKGKHLGPKPVPSKREL